MERFWNKVAIGNQDECWPWLAGRNVRGYGIFQFKGSSQNAHRVAWELTNGEIPKDQWGFTLFVCHTCDNPSCCNPNHLFIGTAKDNSQDMEKKNRHPHPPIRRGSGKGYRKVGIRWQAHIRVNGQRINLGMYNTKEEAHIAYLKAFEETK